MTEPACDMALFSSGYQRHLGPLLSHAVAGGQVADGPFTFCLLLYRDPSLLPPSSAKHPSRMTSIPGIGSAALWVYRGKEMQGRIIESFGLLPNGLTPIGGRTFIRNGQSGGRIGGGVPTLQEAARPEDRVEIGFTVDTPEGTYGARLGFHVADGDVRNALVSPIHHAE